MIVTSQGYNYDPIGVPKFRKHNATLNCDIDMPSLPTKDLGEDVIQVLIRNKALLTWKSRGLSTILIKSIWCTLKIYCVFIIAPCSMKKAALFPKLGLPPIRCCFKGILWAQWPNIVWGEGGNGESVKKGQVYHDFWSGLQFTTPKKGILALWMPSSTVKSETTDSGHTSFWVDMYTYTSGREVAYKNLEMHSNEKIEKRMLHFKKHLSDSVK